MTIADDHGRSGIIRNNLDYCGWANDERNDRGRLRIATDGLGRPWTTGDNRGQTGTIWEGSGRFGTNGAIGDDQECQND